MDNLTKLRYWTFKILPLVYDNSLSYYEVLSKVTAKVNELVDSNNTMPQAITDEISKQLDESYATNINNKINSAVNTVTENANNQIDKLANEVYAKLITAITTDEGTNTFTKDAKNGGELIFLNNTLYKVTAVMPAGTNYIIGINIIPVDISKELKDIKETYLCSNNEYWNERSTNNYSAEKYLFWKDTLYITTKDIHTNDILYADSDNQNLKQVTLASEISNIQKQIYKNDNDIDNLQKNLAQETSRATNRENFIEGRISNIVAQSGNDNTEIVDARIGYDGTTYDTLGTAIRKQVSELNSDLYIHNDIINANLMGIDVQENLYPGAAFWSGTWLNNDPANMGVSSEKFQGYPCVYSSQSFRKYCKNIPVEAGKTYTFECWLKHAKAGAVSINLTTDSLTVNPAAVSPTRKQTNDVPANTWVKFSLTFTCTASGNVSPFAMSATGAFYIAKYNLVEGSTVFSLDDALNEKASIESVSGIGDFLRYNFSLGNSPDVYWNPIIDKEIPTGTKVKLIFDYYSGEYLSYVRIDGKKTDNTWQNGLCRISSPVHGGEAEFTATEKYAGLRVQLARSQNESNVTAAIYLATNSELGITNVLMGMQLQRVFHAEKNGSGDFTSLVEAINTACQYLDSIVYVGAGEWDIIDELGTAYMEAVSSDKSTWGLVLKNRIHLIGTAKTVIKAVNASGSTNFENIKTYFSVFNAGEKGFTLENINIEDENIRYSVHDDRGNSGPEPYTNKYIRCSMIHKKGKYPDCIGAGLGENQTVEIRGCYFEGDLGRPRLVYWHGNNSPVTDALGKITVCDNYFAQDGTFMLTTYGQSNTDTIAYVSNNSFGTAPSVNPGSVAPYDNMQIVAWNNEVRS